MKIKYILAAVTISIISACGGNGDENYNNQLELNGTWVSNCYTYDDFLYVLEEYIYRNNTFELTGSVFNHSSCSGDPVSIIESAGTFTTGNTIQTSTGLEAIEITYNSISSNQESIILSIIRQDNNTFNHGVSVSGDTFPTELNFDIFLTKQ